MHRTALIVAVSVLFLACNDDDPAPVEPPPPPPPPVEPTTFTWEADLEGLVVGEEPEDDFTHLSGSSTVTFTEEEETFSASAAIEGDDEGEVRPWHVHFNTCEEGGGIVGEDEDYPRLTVGEEGTAEASVDVAGTLDPEADYHINVHLADEELGTIIMCGDLVLQEEA